MNICIFWHPTFNGVSNYLEKEGTHEIIMNQFSKDADIIITEFYSHMNVIFEHLKYIKKKKIKLVNIINDIPPWRLEKKFELNTTFKSIRQTLNYYSHKYYSINKFLDIIFSDDNRGGLYGFFSKNLKKSVNTQYKNRILYQYNYRDFLKFSDLNLSLSNYTQFLTKRFLKIDSEVWYPGVNSDLLIQIPKSSEIKYDIINISRIVPTKRQNLIVKAAKELGLKLLIVGGYHDKQLILDCEHYYLPNHFDVLNKLNESRVYVDASIFEGFGMTPVEAAFLNKISIVSDTYVHKEVLGDYPIYFKRNDINDLIAKLNLVIDGSITLNKESVEKIKNKYSLERVGKNLLNYLETLT